ERDSTSLGAAAKPIQASGHNGPMNRSADWLRAQVTDWAERVAGEHPDLERVGVFGSYGRGEASVGSDLDLLLIDQQATGHP
ncbi:MAG: nucleotidyltransferase family protein, partial [Cyanobium sp.]